MTKLQYIIKTFFHYFKANLLVALGVVVSTMVLTGSLIIGDSVRYSLEQSTFYRLGNTTHLVTVAERYFRKEMASEMEKDNSQIKAAPVLLLEGVAVADGGQRRANKVQIVGVDKSFEKISNTSVFSDIQNNEIAISQNLSEQMQVKEGDNLLVRIKKASLIPLNAPFISDEETSVSLRATIKKVVQKDELGRFSLKNSQTAPYNIFLSMDRLNRLMEFKNKANQILIVSDLNTDAVLQSVKHCLTPEDAGLQIKDIEATDEVEVSTERVFMEDKVAKTLEELPSAQPMLTYFVNEISEIAASHKPQAASLNSKNEIKKLEANSLKLEAGIPYSFVSTLASGLGENEIILNQWAADDLGAKIGDSIRLNYWQIGPLRKLIEKKSDFVLKKIEPMTPGWADSTRMPNLPGLSDAGHCRDWEAGVPIKLDAIRDKDEKYWDDYKGAPKAYISLDRALQIWSNRFGNITAVRYSSNVFNKEEYKKVFAENIVPADLGMAVEPIREKGISAAKNGTDFSGLFIGLSFFLLIAGIVLTTLLFRLNLETRTSQVGLLDALGFRKKQVRGFYLWEGFVVALFGGVLGIVVSLFYTRLVFRILNTLWFDIVRTDVLLIKIYPATVAMGLVISLIVSLAAIYISVWRFQRQKTAELQKKSSSAKNITIENIWSVIMILSLFASVSIFISQIFLSKQMDPSLFIMLGGLLLIGLLLIFRRFIIHLENKSKNEISLNALAKFNLARNKGRSLTVVILFALGTFVVVSTGSNKLDLFANAQNKTSGTGGFLYFAETTMPVLFDINNSEKRAEEGILEDFTTVQLRKVEGDDASCLNLNRVSQPAILGVDPASLEGRFSFAAKVKELGDVNPWLALNQTFDDGTIPAIADQTVIQWGLGKKVGDILMYQNELGDTLQLKLIAGTTPSIFQGYVIISNQNFLKNYPSSSGTNIFLIDGKPENEQKIGDELNSVFRDYGWEMELTAKRLVEFYSVTNTYLSIFLALGALGLILGTIGLAVILARTLLERRREIAVMQAIGYSNRPIFKIITTEYLILLFTGVIIGFITAVVATLPAFLSTNSDASFSTVAIVTILILVNGILWIVGLTWFSLQKKKLITGLRVE